MNLTAWLTSPKPKTKTLASPADPIDGLDDDPDTEKADFNKERALHEREKRLIARMERMEKAKQLAYIEDMEIAYNAVLLQLTTLASSAHKRIKAMIPHLTHEELSEIERVISEIFESVSSNEFEELPSSTQQLDGDENVVEDTGFVVPATEAANIQDIPLYEFDKEVDLPNEMDIYEE